MIFTESEHFVEDLKLNLLQISLQIVKQDGDVGIGLGWIHIRSYNNRKMFKATFTTTFLLINEKFWNRGKSSKKIKAYFSGISYQTHKKICSENSVISDVQRDFVVGFFKEFSAKLLREFMSEFMELK